MKSIIIESSLSEIAFMLVFIILITNVIIFKQKNDIEKDLEIVISIPGEFLFDTGEAELKEKAKIQLEDISKTIIDTINTFDIEKKWSIRIEGHTDDRPICNAKFKSNWELSTARAISVVRFYIDRNIFSPDSLQAMGYGDTKPIVPNNSIINMQKNRRVEIRLTKAD
ncbi:MAG: OmpA family protein [Candidatus Cloacimonetes bacterium]|nr:OmpA family protein [Candidatus Cloacimonadota bacterium]